jgi:hypothetical protein
MSEWALLEGDLITQVIVVDDENDPPFAQRLVEDKDHPATDAVDLAAHPGVGIGHVRQGRKFVEPEPEPAPDRPVDPRRTRILELRGKGEGRSAAESAELIDLLTAALLGEPT